MFKAIVRNWFVTHRSAAHALRWATGIDYSTHSTASQALSRIKF